MITGDYPGTALAVAREVGVDDSGGCLTGAEVARWTTPRLPGASAR
jgi:Ca2+-transporting ATPase